MRISFYLPGLLIVILSAPRQTVSPQIPLEGRCGFPIDAAVGKTVVGGWRPPTAEMAVLVTQRLQGPPDFEIFHQMMEDHPIGRAFSGDGTHFVEIIKIERRSDRVRGPLVIGGALMQNLKSVLRQLLEERRVVKIVLRLKHVTAGVAVENDVPDVRQFTRGGRGQGRRRLVGRRDRRRPDFHDMEVVIADAEYGDGDNHECGGIQTRSSRTKIRITAPNQRPGHRQQNQPENNACLSG